MSWDGFQREVLAELGLRPYALASAPAVDARAVDAPQDAAPSDGVGARSGTLSPTLLAALARAAGCAPARVVALAGIAAPPSDIAARRALWPRLRRLRRQAR